MRKITFVSPLYFCGNLLCITALGLICLPAFAQDDAPAAAPAKDAPAATQPTDPKALMLLAAKMNGLTGDDVKPWHLKANWTLLDEQGSIKDIGTYEELWASKTKYKLTFIGRSFTHTQYGTKDGAQYSGDPISSIAQLYIVRAEFADPLPSSQMVLQNNFIFKPYEANGAKYECIIMKKADGGLSGKSWCLGNDKPVLRTSFFGQGGKIEHEKIINFQGHFIAGDLKILRPEKSLITAYLESIEPLNAVDDAVFIPPPDAKILSSGRFTVPPGVSRGSLFQKVEPVYPPDARKKGVAGTVSIQAIIGKDGHVSDLKVLSGPPMLQQAAVDAVKQWVYRPYRNNGEAVEVETTINVIFTLNQ